MGKPVRLHALGRVDRGRLDAAAGQQRQARNKQKDQKKGNPCQFHHTLFIIPFMITSILSGLSNNYRPFFLILELTFLRVKTQIRLFSLIAAAAVLYGIFIFVLPSHKENRPAPAVTAPAQLAPVAFYDENGKKFTLDDFKGKVLLVNLWATWCPPCVLELPALDKLQARLKDKNFKVIAISMDRTSILDVTSFLADKSIDHLKAYWDKNREIPAAWKYDGLPTSYLIGTDGHVIARLDGSYDWAGGKMFDRIAALVK
jgi:thiol-disulfide isomerase/thioredoxin